MNKIKLLLFLLSLFFLAIITGCGNKKMPKPVLKEEMFYWRRIDFKYSKGCLFVEAELKGRCKNLKSVSLEVDEACIKCPFKGKILRSEVKQKGCYLFLKSCGIEKPPFRFRLWGQNIYNGLDTVSRCFVVK